MLFSAFDTRFAIDSSDAEFERLVLARYGGLRSAEHSEEAVRLRWRYLSGPDSLPRLVGPSGQAHTVGGPFEALHCIDRELVVALQRVRPDLLFLHSAALVRGGRACLLAAPSGVGKSMTTWAMLHHGFSYVSDELSGVDVDTLEVSPYPRALCLKHPPPAPYALPSSAIRSGDCSFLSTGALPAPTVHASRRVAAVFVLERGANASAAKVQEMGTAEASARLYVTALNALAHPDRGLASVLKVARAVPCYRLSLGPLEDTCRLILETFDSLPQARRSVAAASASHSGLHASR